MTSVNVTTQKNTVTVQQGDATTVTVTTQGAQGATGAGISAGDKGSLTVAANLTDWTLNDSVVTNAKVASDAAIAGSKISPTFSSQLLVHQATAPQIRINSASNDSSATRFTFGLATGSNQFINGAASNDSCIATPSNILFGIGNTRKFRIKTNDVLTDVDFIPSANDATSLGRSNARWSDLFAVDANISGNLTVSGTTTTIDTTTLTVEDKNIELGKVGSPTDITADGGGITLLGDTNHTFNWLNATDSWTSSEHIALPDNKKLQLGDSQDLKMYFDGTNSYINSQSVFLFIQSSGSVIIENTNGENYFKGNANGSVELYHDNVKRFETTSTGADITGILTTDGANHNGDVQFFGSNYGAFWDKSASALKILDNTKLIIGTSSDLTLVHDGTDSKITNTTGNLLIEAKDGETGIKVIPDGNVELYHDNVKKAETSADGLNVTDGRLFLYNSTIPHIRLNKTSGDTASTRFIFGIATGNDSFITGATQNTCCIKTGGNNMMFGISNDKKLEINSDGVNLPDNSKLQLGDSQDLKIFHNGVNSFIEDSGTGALALLTSQFVVKNPANTELFINAVENGAVELYHDNVKRAETTSTGFDVTGILKAINKVNIHDNGTSTPMLQLTNSVTGTGTEDGFRIGYSTNSNVAFFIAGESNSAFQIKTGSSGANAERLNISNTGVFTVKSNSENMLVATPNAGVELYHDNVKRIETTNEGIAVSGDGQFYGFTSGRNLKWDASEDRLAADDNTKITLGNSQDLEIYHDSNNSVIDSNTGNLYLQSANNLFIQGANNENIIKYIANGAVELYHDNVKKLETTSSGVTVSGNLLTGNLNAVLDGNTSISLQDTGHGFGASEIKLSNGGRDLNIIAPVDIRLFPQNGENGIVIEGNGSVELYHDNVKKLETTSSGITVQGSVTTQDMNMSNLNGTANEVDSTKGSWSIQEGADDLFIINRVSGKKYKFNLTEIS